MLKNYYFYFNHLSNNPHNTLALEEYFVNNIGEADIILYLYKHRDSVIIGKNQNARVECRYNELEEDGGVLARRISGGGAVFHDMNNLNFSFIVHKDNYDLHKNLEVILNAVKSFGINATFSGRNDITCEGRKFSGNAFCHRGNGIFHHGTILINSDINKLTHYLNVSKEKIESKGIASVRSRVINLAQLNDKITVNSMMHALNKSFNEVYGTLTPLIITDKMQKEADKISERNASWDFIFGLAPKFDVSLKQRFTWGEVDLLLQLRDGHVEEAFVYSDAMDAELIEKIPSALKGKRLISQELSEAVLLIDTNVEGYKILTDISNFILDQQY